MKEKMSKIKRNTECLFEEAKTIFSDAFGRLMPDPKHSEGEECFLLKNSDTIRMADEKGIAYQSLINQYLRDCANEHRELSLKWV